MGLWRRDDRSEDSNELPGASFALGEECEAYLSGHYAMRYPNSSYMVPGWVRLNEVAHATLDELDAVASGAPVADPTDRIGVRAELAMMLVNAAGGDEQRARRLQLAILQPLETRLSHLTDIVTPRQLVVLVEASLAGEWRRGPRR